MLRRVLLSAAVLCATTAFVPSSAHALAVCLENDTLTVAPPLGYGNQFGMVTIAWEDTCANVPGALRGSHGSGSVTYPYFGSCAAAVVAEGTESVVIGGAVYVMAYPSGGKAMMLVPDTACPVSSASGTGVAFAQP